MNKLKTKVLALMLQTCIEQGTTAQKIIRGYTVKRGVKTKVSNPFTIGKRSVWYFMEGEGNPISPAALQKMCDFYGLED